MIKDVLLCVNLHLKPYDVTAQGGCSGDLTDYHVL